MNLRYFSIRFALFSLFLHANIFANTCQWRLFDAQVLGTLGDRLEKAVLERNVGLNCLSNAIIALSELGHHTRATFRYLEPHENVLDIPSVPDNKIAIERVSLILPDLEIESGRSTLTLLPAAHSFILIYNKKSFILCDSFDQIHDFYCRESSRKEIENLNWIVYNYLKEKNVLNHADLLGFFLDKADFKKFSSIEFTQRSSQHQNFLKTSDSAIFFRDLVKKNPSKIKEFFLYLEEIKASNAQILEEIEWAITAQVPLIEKVHIEIPWDYKSIMTQSSWKNLPLRLLQLIKAQFFF